MYRHIKVFAVGLASLGGMTVFGQADTQTQSIQQLLGQGFEIKAVNILSGDMLPWIGTKPGDTAPRVLATFQRGAAIAVCEVLMVNWDNLPQQTVENPKLCAVVHEGVFPATPPAAPAPAPQTAPAPAPGTLSVPAPVKPQPGANDDPVSPMEN